MMGRRVLPRVVVVTVGGRRAWLRGRDLGIGQRPRWNVTLRESEATQVSQAEADRVCSWLLAEHGIRAKGVPVSLEGK